MKRFWALVLAIAMILGCLSGCASEQKTEEAVSKTEEKKEENKTAETEEKTEETVENTKPVITEPVTITVLTRRHSTATNDASDIWIFHYLEYWLAQQGYDVTIEVQQTSEPDQQLSLMLGTGTLPDLIWGVNLSAVNTVTYGAGEGMILDWTPYLNEQYMPNLYGMLSTTHKDALNASTYNDAVYSLPSLYYTRNEYGASFSFGRTDRVFVNEAWLDACGLEMPKTIEEFLDMLRAFKDVKAADGSASIPLVVTGDYFEKALWMLMGYYGDALSKYGNTIALKNDELVMPIMTEDYRTLIEIMHTCYEEGLISPDYFTMDTTTARGLTQSGNAGVVCDATMAYLNDVTNWTTMEPFPVGEDTTENVITLDAMYSLGKVWASADTKYPELIAMIIDYLYSPEGSYYHKYGPRQGEDPLGMVDGWYLNDKGEVTTAEVENGTYANVTAWQYQYIFPRDDVGCQGIADVYLYELPGLEKQDMGERTITDKITGETLTGIIKKEYSNEDADGRWRITNGAASEPYVTTVRIPTVYLEEEVASRASDLSVVLKEHINAESAKFITGTRPMEEIDAFWEELKSMGIEEYYGIYKDALGSFMETYY